MRGHQRFAVCLSATSICFSAACTKVPDLNVDRESIRLLDLVKRVKCDIYYAVSTERVTPNGPVIVPISRLHDYAWLSNWVIQVNLNLIVNDQSGITPGVTLIDPLKPAILTGIGTFSQMYSTGIGAGGNTTAARTESISFSLSLSEIESELGSTSNRAKYNFCNLSDGNDLDSDLKLREWVWSSLAPVTEEYLRAGHHKSPKSGGTTSPAASGAKALAGSTAYSMFLRLEPKEFVKNITAPTPVEQLSAFMEDIRKSIVLVNSTWADESPGGASKPPVPGAVSDKELENVFEHERLAIGQIHKALSLLESNPKNIAILAYIAALPHSPQFNEATFKHYLRSIEISFNWDLILFRLSRSKDSTPDQIRGLIAKIDKDITLLNSWERDIIDDIVKQLRTVRGALTAALTSFDPPIDSLSHQVQFVVAWSANVSPSWSLVKFRGPSPSSGPLLSGSSSNTHTLSIVLGPPGADTASTLAALQIGNSVQSALNNTTVKITLPP
jgi:hypothetical protein